MSETVSYIDKCVAAVESIDHTVLSELELGTQIGSGNFHAVYSLGKMSVLGSELDCGLKIPIDISKTSAELNLMIELGGVEQLLRYAPQFLDKVPRFMAAVAIEGQKPLAVLTEDASRGGAVKVESLDDNDRIVREISQSIRGSKEVTLNVDAARNSLSFSAGGEERLLDFSPPPVGDRKLINSVDMRAHDVVREEKTLVISINSDSPLGQSLIRLDSRIETL